MQMVEPEILLLILNIIGVQGTEGCEDDDAHYQHVTIFQGPSLPESIGIFYGIWYTIGYLVTIPPILIMRYYIECTRWMKL
jgi:hypothetical protein